LKHKRHEVNWARRRFKKIIKKYLHKNKFGIRTAKKLLRKIKKKHHYRKVSPNGRRVWRKKFFKKSHNKKKVKRG